MEKQKEYLLKHFASLLRGIALQKEKAKTIDPNVAHCLSRKDLIQILKIQCNGTIPKEYNLVELEKLELLELIENELLIVSFMTQKWCGESPQINKNKQSQSDEPSQATKKIEPVKKEAPKAQKKDATVSK